MKEELFKKIMISINIIFTPIIIYAYINVVKYMTHLHNTPFIFFMTIVVLIVTGLTLLIIVLEIKQIKLEQECKR